MRTPWLRTLGPNMQVIAFVLVFFICALLTGAITQVALNLFFEIDLSTNAGAITDLTDPKVLSAYRLMSILNSIGVFLIPALVIYRLISYPVEDFLKMKKNPSLIFLLILVAVGICMQAPTNFIYDLNQQISFPESLSGLESTIITMEEERLSIIEGLFANGNTEALFINLFILAVLPALAEEFFFRGALQQLFQRAFNNKHHIAIWMTALVFSFIHFQFLGFFPRVLLGALLGYVFYYSGNIWYAVFLHFINNAVGVLVHYFVIHKQVDSSYEMFGAADNEKIPLIISTIILAGLIIWWKKKNSSENSSS